MTLKKEHLRFWVNRRVIIGPYWLSSGSCYFWPLFCCLFTL